LDLGIADNIEHMRVLVVSIIAVLVLFQNCNSSGPQIDFNSNRQQLTSQAQGGSGGSFDGKPTPGTYCRVFDNLSCQTASANIQSTLMVDATNITLATDNCASTSTKFSFGDVAVDYTNFAPEYVGLTRGIFKKCELGTNSLPQPPTEMADAFCTSSQNKLAVIINKNLATQNLDLNLVFNDSSGVRSVKTNLITKTQNSGGTTYSSSSQKFDLSIPSSISQTSQGRLVAMVDNTAIDVPIECRQASSTPTVVIDKDLELSPTWIDTTRLAGYWKLNEVNATEGSSILDSSALNFSGKLLTTNDGGNKSNSSVLGGALNFDGLDDYVEMLDPVDKHLDFGTSSFTYMLWIYKSGNTELYDTPIWKGGNCSTCPGYDIECGSNSCHGLVSDGSVMLGAAFAANGNSFIGRWVHFTVVVDRSSQELRTYLDGASVANSSISGLGSVTSADHFNIGAGRGGLHPIIGSMDDVAVWNGVLSDAEILEIYQRLRPKF
jgi:hypothetical protein